MIDCDKVVFHRDWRSHPIIGFDARRPEIGNTGSKHYYSPSGAFLHLQEFDCVDRQFPGISGNLMTLALSTKNRALFDPCRLWNWTHKGVRRFYSDLAICGLATDDLTAHLTSALVSERADRDSLPSAKRSIVLAKTGGLCVYCGTALTTERNKPNSYHADHVLPVALGGSDDIGNLVPSCRTCNLNKRDGTALKFMGGYNAG